MAKRQDARDHKIELAATKCRSTAAALREWVLQLDDPGQRIWVRKQAEAFEEYSNEIIEALASNETRRLRAALEWSVKAGAPFMVGSVSLAAGGLAIAQEFTEQPPEYLVQCVADHAQATDDALRNVLRKGQGSELPLGQDQLDAIRSAASEISLGLGPIRPTSNGNEVAIHYTHSGDQMEMDDMVSKFREKIISHLFFRGQVLRAYPAESELGLQGALVLELAPPR